MLVFVSDIHLTDGAPEGTSTATIRSGAFQKFTLYLEDMAKTAKAKEIRIVLLGDILDLIRSEYWLRSTIRPWSDAAEKDAEGKGLKDYAMAIVERICENPVNKASMAHLREFTDAMTKSGVLVEVRYLPGNHDWLVNRYPETRQAVAAFLGLSDPVQYEKKVFPTADFWESYRVFARHGDIYDPFNFSENRDASSVGDAIVIDLLTKFATTVAQAPEPAGDPDLIEGLRQIDNVRPLIDIPLWVQGICRRAKSVATAKKVKETWNDLADAFLRLPYVRSCDKPWRMDIVDGLQVGLKISTLLSLRNIINCPIRDLCRTGQDYMKNAFNEEYMKKNMAEYVVYGHTHAHQITPLDLVPGPGEPLNKMYFNTGTWRRVHEKTAFDSANCEFLSRHVMTFVAFYLNDERGDYQFEVWNGALG